MPDQDYGLNDELARERMGEIAFSAAMGAGLMLFFAFYLGNLRGVSTSQLYNLSVGAFIWTLRLGGASMGLAAVGLWLGFRPALLADAILALLIGALLVVIGVIWLANSDLEGALQILFGALFLRSGRASWGAWSGLSVMPGEQQSFAPDEDEDQESGMPPPDPAARQASMDRLLAAKKREKRPEPPVQASLPPARQRPPVNQERETPPEPTAVRPSAPVPIIDLAPVPLPEPAAAAPEPSPQTTKTEPSSPDEPPPEGFLAQLGKDD